MPEALARIIRSKFEDGTLPHDNPTKLWTRKGSGNQCVACEQRILQSQTEYEAEYDDGRPSFRSFRFHVGCHGLWEAERRRRGYVRFND